MSNVDAFHAMAESDPVLAYRTLQLRLMLLNRKLSVQSIAREMDVSREYLTRVLYHKVPTVAVEFLDRIDDAVHTLTERGKENA